MKVSSWRDVAIITKRSARCTTTACLRWSFNQAAIAKFHADYLESFINRTAISDLWKLYYLIQEENAQELVEQQLDI